MCLARHDAVTRRGALILRGGDRDEADRSEAAPRAAAMKRNACARSLAYDHVPFLRSGGLARAGGSEIDRKMKLCPQIMSPQNVRFRRRAGMLAADGLRDWAASLHPQRHSAA
jgi:hypothetical protein